MTALLPADTSLAAVDPVGIVREILLHLRAGGAVGVPQAGRAARAHAASLGLDWYLHDRGLRLPLADQRAIITELIARLEVEDGGAEAEAGPVLAPVPQPRDRIPDLAGTLIPEVMAQLDLSALSGLTAEAQRSAIRSAVLAASADRRLQLNGAESARLVSCVIDDMLGLGPLEPLLADDSISDIMVNGPGQVYVERHGQLEPTGIRFRDNEHVLNLAVRMVSDVGRRIDETVPLVDARLRDGSRINVTIPPLAIDGPVITIRKFPKEHLGLRDLVRFQSLSVAMADFLRLVARIRLNIIISGGTGSGKTTLLNALSREISAAERIVTIEDAAELRLQQPHVVRLETRPANIEGTGEVTMRHLLRNALRMRPDRIILGEVRSEEVLDLMQAMNTGHDGSMSTLHANSPREALTRLENMIAMSGVRLAPDMVRSQLKDAIHIIVQISRMRDGVRRIQSISELVGVDSNVVTMQEVFRFVPGATSTPQHVHGHFECTGNLPAFLGRAAEYGLEPDLRATLER